MTDEDIPVEVLIRLTCTVYTICGCRNRTIKREQQQTYLNPRMLPSTTFRLWNAKQEHQEVPMITLSKFGSMTINNIEDYN